MIIDKKKEWHILNRNKLIKWTLIRLPFIVDGSEKMIHKRESYRYAGDKNN